MECLLELDDEVMEEPHVELVDEAVGCDQPIRMNRILYLPHFERISRLTWLVYFHVDHVQLL